MTDNYLIFAYTWQNIEELMNDRQLFQIILLPKTFYWNISNLWATEGTRALKFKKFGKKCQVFTTRLLLDFCNLSIAVPPSLPIVLAPH